MPVTAGGKTAGTPGGLEFDTGACVSGGVATNTPAPMSKPRPMSVRFTMTLTLFVEHIRGGGRPHVTSTPGPTAKLKSGCELPMRRRHRQDFA